MPEDPFNSILNQLGELLKLIEKNASKPIKGPISPLVEKELIRIDEMINRLDDIVEDEMRKEGKTAEEGYQNLEKNPQLYSETEKKILKHCRDLGVNAFVLRTGLQRAIKASKVSKMRQMGKNTKKSIQKRRNKFKGMDGGQTWKRL